MLLPLRRTLRRPLYALIGVITIALSLGATGVSTALIEALWLSPATEYDARRLVRMWEVAPNAEVPLPLSLPRIRAIDDNVRSLDEVAAYTRMELTLQVEEPVRMQSAAVTHNFFDTYRAPLVHGREFTEQDVFERVVLVSEVTWREQFGGSATLPGSTISLNGRAYTVIGIVPDVAGMPDRAVRLWIPIESEFDFLDDPTLHRLQVVGRLRTGATYDQLRQELRSPALATLAGDEGHVAEAETLDRWLYGDSRERARWLVLAALCMLLVAVANWGSLVTARSIELGREMSIRDALGAPRGTGFLHAIAEQAVLVSFAFPLALWGMFALQRILGSILADPARMDIGIDAFGTLPLLAMGIIAVVTTTFVTLAARPPVRPSLDVETRAGGSIGGRRRTTAFNVIVAAEVAGAVVLSTLAASLLQRHADLSVVDPGYDAAGLTLVSLTLAGTSYRSSREVESYYRLAQEELTRHPAVSGVTAIDGLPLGEDPGVEELLVEGRDPGLQRWDGVRLHNVLGDYFSVSGTSLLEGRDFRAMEQADAPVAIVSESLARAVWGDRSPLGASIRLARWRDEPWRTVVGVAADVRNLGLAEAPGYIVYEPHSQFPKRQMTLMARSGSADVLNAAELVRVLRSLDPGVPIDRPVAFDEHVRASIDVERREARAGTTIATLVMLLACAGIFGIVSFQLASQRRELAMRAALGAGPRVLIVHALGVALRPALAGAAVGGAVTFALNYSFTSGPWLPALSSTLISAAFVFVAALLAALIPAVRFGRVAAAEVLRQA